MSADLDMSNNRANIAFLGSRNDIWHRLGTEMVPGMSIDQWATASGLNWTAHKVPALAQLDNGETIRVPERHFIVRDDTNRILGLQAVSDVYQVVQPADVLQWFGQYIAVDDRFALDVAGSLDGGSTIWATARYNGDTKIAGESHVARVLMSTTFDGTGATVNQMTMTRVVCRNTLRLANSDNRAVIRTRHNTRFNAEAVGRELANLAKSVEQFRAVGDAMATHHLAKDEISAFFKAMLDIPFDAKREDISTRKANQFSDLSRAYGQSIREGAAPESAWAALQAVTRYVDHDRPSSRATDDQIMYSTQFGSGAGLKDKAMGLLMPLIKDRVALVA